MATRKVSSVINNVRNEVDSRIEGLFCRSPAWTIRSVSSKRWKLSQQQPDASAADPITTLLVLPLLPRTGDFRRTKGYTKTRHWRTFREAIVTLSVRLAISGVTKIKATTKPVDSVVAD
jgi:hypothetical protein